MQLVTGDSVDHPPHYLAHPSGIECIEITEHMGFCLGNAVKYIWRADLKGDAIEDLRKAAWYIQRELEKRLQAAESLRAGVEAPAPVVPVRKECGARPRGGPMFACTRSEGHLGDHSATIQGELLGEWPR